MKISELQLQHQDIYVLHLDCYLKDKSHVIWDWNGTLLDDVDVTVAVISDILERYQMPPLSKEQYLKAFRFPVIDYYRDIGFTFQTVSFEVISQEFISAYRHKAKDCALFSGAEELLKHTKQNGIKHCILSAAHQDHLEEILIHHKLRDHFNHVFGLSDHYATSKITRGKHLLQELHCPLSKIILIGDTDHDLDVGKALGIDVLLIADGHQDYDRLKSIHSQVLRSRYDFDF
jgi:phosphoglycolate phosphatase